MPVRSGLKAVYFVFQATPLPEARCPTVQPVGRTLAKAACAKELSERRPFHQRQSYVEVLPLAEDVISDAVADPVVQPDVDLELPGRHLQPPAVDADDDVLLPYPRLAGGLGDEGALGEGQLLLGKAQP